ncbi:MAG TPA: hypothetical protein VHY22_08480 [Chthoniobacteraceae bacterium]|jgi:hypothetical protein|nr:hypothetical protein [Chthoniobacteraceae bacterium]
MNPIQEILVLHHSHTDIGFTHPQPVLWELQRRFIDRALDLLDETEDWPAESRPNWTCETTAPVIHWLHNTSRAQIKRFRHHVEQSRLSIGAMFCHFTPMTSADEIARTLQPIRELRETLGAPIRAAIVHDINGLPRPCTQLLLDAGVELLIMGINVHFGGFPLTRPMAFHWIGADGRPLLTFNGEHYQLFDRLCGLKTAGMAGMAEGLGRYTAQLAAQGYPLDFAFLTATHHTLCDNNPPNAATARLIRQWNEEGGYPLVRYATPEMLLERLRRVAHVPSHSGEWTDYWAFGVQIAARETRISRESKGRLEAAELLHCVTGAGDSLTRRHFAEAWHAVAIFDEHTFGSLNCVEHPDFDDTATQWTLKAACAHQARSLANLLLRDQLDALARNPVEACGIEGVLVFNPAPVARRAYVRMPEEWLCGKWDHLSAGVHFLEITRERWERGEGALIGPIDLPAWGWKIVPVAELKQAQAEASLGAGEGFIESPFYRLEFDPETGRILALHDKRLGLQWIDQASPWQFFGLVQETVRDGGGRDAFFDFDWEKIPYGHSCWKPDWPAQRLAPARLQSLATRIEPDGASVTFRWADAPGVDGLEQRIKLPAHRPAIELLATFRKLDIATPESIYFAFPLALTGWRAHFDPANQPSEFDTGQLPGTCRDYVTAGQWVAVHNGDGCVTLACPDDPLVQIGGFHFGKEQQSVPRENPALLLSWAMNNYYNVNFRGPSQPDPARFRYELTTQPRFDPAASTAAGAEAAQRTEVHPVVKLDGPIEGKLIEVHGAGAMLQGIRSASDGSGIIAILSNVTDNPVCAKISIPDRRVRQAFRCGTLEQNLGALMVENEMVLAPLEPHSLLTVRLLIEQR